MKEEDKTGEQDSKEEKCGWGLDALYASHRRKRPILPINRNHWKTTTIETLTQTANNKAKHSEYDQKKTAMGTGDGETE